MLRVLFVYIGLMEILPAGKYISGWWFDIKNW
jgi:hypothetical protein